MTSSEQPVSSSPISTQPQSEHLTQKSIKKTTVVAVGKGFRDVNMQLIVKSVNKCVENYSGIEIFPSSVKITVPNANEAIPLFKLTSIAGINVRVLKEEDFNKKYEKPTRVRGPQGIIHGVPTGIPIEEIEKELASSITSCRRLGKSKSVQLGFRIGSSLPESVVIVHRRFNVKNYTPTPVRCYHCQGFGHMTGTCKQTPRCPKCGDPHPVQECEAEKLTCPNCSGPHHARDPSCPKYAAAKERIAQRSYAAAATSAVAPQPRPAPNTGRRPSTPPQDARPKEKQATPVRQQESHPTEERDKITASLPEGFDLSTGVKAFVGLATALITCLPSSTTQLAPFIAGIARNTLGADISAKEMEGVLQNAARLSGIV
jgi:hypothetical protein